MGLGSSIKHGVHKATHSVKKVVDKVKDTGKKTISTVAGTSGVNSIFDKGKTLCTSACGLGQNKSIGSLLSNFTGNSSLNNTHAQIEKDLVADYC